MEMPPSNPYPNWSEEEARSLVERVIEECDPGPEADAAATRGAILVAAADEGMPPPLTEEVLARFIEEDRVIEVWKDEYRWR